MSCEHSCHSCGGCGGHTPQLSPTQLDFLNQLAQISYLPLCQFVLVPKGCLPEEGTVILSPVLLETQGDSLEQVMSTANQLVALARMRLISLDFGVPLSNYPYDLYYRSALFREFTANFQNRPEGKPVLRRGSVAITGAGVGYLEEQGRL